MSIPVRQCVGCRAKKEKTELLRVVKSSQGEIQLDTLGKLPGRGAYLCCEEACLKKIQKSRGLERGLSTAIPLVVYEALAEKVKAMTERGNKT
ncbi:MAG: YlxR family protein [Eubacteriales bacterium]